MSRGFLIFAHNNSQVDYGLVALCNALMIKSNLKVNSVTLVTDSGTLSWLKQSRGEDLVARAFDNVHVVKDWGLQSEKAIDRRFHDTLSTTHNLPWHNKSRPSAYTISPYDETILIDCDYLVCDKSMDMVWGSDEPYLINRDARTLEHKPVPMTEQMLDPFTIPMFWATCVYFRKCEEAKLLFDLVSQIQENYTYYQYVYGFKGKLYRNDYAFSIALHMLNGFRTEGIQSLPVPTILTSYDCDELQDVRGKNDLMFLVNDTTDRWMFRLSRVTGVNVHVMNKFSIIRNADKIIGLYGS